jgi:uncharacterized alkaline shock family protein YloU
MSLVLENASGTVTVTEGVLVGIAARAAESVEGIRVRRRRTIDLEARAVRLSVAVRRGEPLVELAERAQVEVAAALKKMCGIDTTVEIAIGALE